MLLARTALRLLARSPWIGALLVIGVGVAEPASSPHRAADGPRSPQVLLILDRSGSALGQELATEKSMASTLLDLFATTPDSVGVLSFATSTRIDQPLTQDAATAKGAVNSLTASGWSDIEGALARAGTPTGLADQSGIPTGSQAPQFVILFTDGTPTAFRGQFLYRGIAYDGVIGGSCDQAPTFENKLWSPTVDNGSVAGMSLVTPTGDGLAIGSACGSTSSVRWFAFDTYPVPGYVSTACSIPGTTSANGEVGGPLGAQTCWLVENLVYVYADQLKNRGVRIYTIGVGTANAGLLTKAASDASYYSNPTSNELTQIFEAIQASSTTPGLRESWGRLKLHYR